MTARAILPSILGLTLVSAIPAPAAEPPIAAQPDTAAQAVNRLGCELLRQGTQPTQNALLSPYSIQTALAMTFAGAAGDTRTEMARVLHFSGDEAQLHASFAALQRALEELAARTVKRAASARERGNAVDPVTLTIANRLFGQADYAFRPPFLNLLKDVYGAPFQPLDFVKDTGAATRAINAWVEEQTRERIRDLIPPGALDAETRLVLVNAIYLKAPWAQPFPASATQPRPFHVAGGPHQSVPTMFQQDRFGYARHDGFSAIALPYLGSELQFVVLLPDNADGLPALETRLTAELLAACAQPPTAQLQLYLPKLKLQPPLIRLGQALRTLGLKSAFDLPPGSADFDRMAPRKPDDYLRISEVFHKTFLELDEKGTEAAAATAVAMVRVTSALPGKPIEVRVDRPFLFAIQHRPSGACLFLGRIVDPR
jgi:serpin B